MKSSCRVGVPQILNRITFHTSFSADEKLCKKLDHVSFSDHLKAADRADKEGSRRRCNLATADRRVAPRLIRPAIYWQRMDVRNWPTGCGSAGDL